MKRKILLKGLMLFLLLSPVFSDDDKEEPLFFSDYWWIVKTSRAAVGPGPNHFSSDGVQENSRGIELEIRKQQGRWRSGEIFTLDHFGYGTHSLLFSIPEPLDSNAVFGFFLYNSDEPPFYNEIDFEAARWGVAENPPFSFTLQPYAVPGNSLAFYAEEAGEYLCRIAWQSEEILFTLSDETGRILLQWAYRGDAIPVDTESRIHLNLWLFQGRPPAGDGGLRVQVFSYKYEPNI